MRRVLAILPLFVLIFALQIVGQTPDESTDKSKQSRFDPELAKKVGADDYGMRSYFFVLLKTGKTQIEDEKERSKVFAGHFANMKRLAGEGKLVLAGPYSDPKGIWRGMFAFSVANLEEATKLAESDPAVAAGVFDFEIVPFYASAGLMLVNEIHPTVQKKQF